MYLLPLHVLSSRPPPQLWRAATVVRHSPSAAVRPPSGFGASKVEDELQVTSPCCDRVFVHVECLLLLLKFTTTKNNTANRYTYKYQYSSIILAYLYRYVHCLHVDFNIMLSRNTEINYWAEGSLKLYFAKTMPVRLLYDLLVQYD